MDTRTKSRVSVNTLLYAGQGLRCSEDLSRLLSRHLLSRPLLSRHLRVRATLCGLKLGNDLDSPPMFASPWLGTLDYQAGLRAQDEAYRLALASGEATILGLEHSHTVTLGKRGDRASDLFASHLELAAEGVAVVHADRGGQATLHSPGQLVIYPILPLKNWGLGPRAYIELLEETTIQTLASLGVSVTRKTDEPGLYSDAGKMVFFGVRIRNGVSLHGLSLNVRNDLSKFAWIRSCGRTAEAFDRVSEHGWTGSPPEMFSLWIQQFSRVLGLTLDSSQAGD